jgi:hypothetical protein
MLGIGANDATAHDVLKQLVAGLLKWRGFHGSCVPSCSYASLRLGHEFGLEV